MSGFVRVLLPPGGHASSRGAASATRGPAVVLLLAMITGLLTALVAPASAATVNSAVPSEPAPSTVSGHVRDAATGQPIAGVCASLVKPGDDWTQYGQGCTDDQGAYSISDAEAGRWFVLVDDKHGKYAAGLSGAFNLAAGQDKTGVDVKMSLGGSLTGVVKDRDTGRPLARICPSVYAGRTGSYVEGQQRKCSDRTGRWVVSAVPAGRMTVMLPGDKTHIDRWAADAETQKRASLYVVRPEEKTSVGAVRLYRGGRVSGRITNRRGEPVKGAYVVLGDYAPRSGPGEGRYTAATNADGRYTIKNVPKSRQTALAYAYGQPYAWQWSGRAADPAKAKKLKIRYGKKTTWNAVLQPQARIAVTLTGVPEDDWAQVDVFTRSGDLVGFAPDIAGPGGKGFVDGLPTSSVKLRVLVDDAERAVWYPGRIEVVSGRTTSVSMAIPPRD